MITVDKSYQLGDHRHEPAAWRCIEVHAGTSVLELLTSQQQQLFKAWFLKQNGIQDWIAETDAT